MNEIVIEVYVPAINKVFDLVVPSKARVYEVTPLLNGIISRLAEGLYISNDAILCERRTGKIYRKDVTLEEVNIKNASRVMLI